ncbi:AraC family transcriptional regulator [Metabacillus idriensis]|uniref:helix-turn-helix transcriptional regulator n=1 Tax=Metabacillus idriensis TaxID=324768 RepID=UPI003D2E5256
MQVICEKRTYSREFHSHQHDFGQFLFPLQGSLEIHTDLQKLNLREDSCFYIPPDFTHLYRSKDRNEFLILDIPTLYLQGKTESMYLKLDQQWSSIRFLLLEEAGSKRAGLNDLTRYVAQKLQKSLSPSIAYLHEHYKRPIKMETLAGIEHYHPVYYSSWFKEKTGKSLKAYISELRMKEAKRLLMGTSWSISAISEEVGFENVSSFTRWFTCCEGISPKACRKMNKG